MTDGEVDAGPSPTFEELYRRELAAVVALAYVLSGSRTAAEELAQEAFLAAHRSWDRIGRYDDPAAWVRRVCANRAVSVVRRRASEARALVRLGARRAVPDELPADSAEFWRAVRRLPRRQAQVVALHYLEDRPVDEVAAILGVAGGTVKAHLHRARRALARELGCQVDDGGEEGWA
ncbi:MAG TPA: sigma-70 family RNA polymerase sigma factor [Acidimicrobiales bacterium]|nr:sigma-70 family RNA polymerase sigma factor [Acidimicrobiales bacterium]